MIPFHIRGNYIVTAPTYESLQRRIQSETFPELIARNATFTGVEVVDGAGSEDKKGNRKLLKLGGTAIILFIGLVFSAQVITRIMSTFSIHDKYSTAMTGNFENFLDVNGSYSVCYDPSVFKFDRSASTSSVRIWKSKNDGSEFTVTLNKALSDSYIGNVLTSRSQDFVSQGYTIQTRFWSDKGYVIVATKASGILYERALAFSSGDADILKITMPATKDTSTQRIRTAQVMGGCFMPGSML